DDLDRPVDHDPTDAERIARARLEAERARVEAAEVAVQAAERRLRLVAERAEGRRRAGDAVPLDALRERLSKLERMKGGGRVGEDEFLRVRAELERTIAEREAGRLGDEAQARIDELDAEVAFAEARARLALAR